MKTTMLIAAMIIASTGSAALAAQMTGTIKSISKARDTITLVDGRTFHLPERIEVQTLSVGERVQLTYAVGKGRIRQISGLRPVQ
jgi:hypothetical protein